MHVSAQFDSGNIEVIDATDPSDVRLAIRPDVGGEHLQWFHFRVVGARDVACTLRIVNAGKASYPQGWPGYRACVSADRRAWRRVATTYTDGELRISLTPTHDAVYVAYFAPYSHERHLDLVARAAQAARCRHAVLGWTLDGRDLDHLRVGEPGEGRRVVWIIARQHPGESMAEWFVEGLLDRLLDPSCALARWLLDRAVFHIVPNMNPDGSSRGHLRTNAAGVNLNRVWHAPDLERSPEVKLVRDAMDATGVDLCLDIHGDEAIPYNFAAGAEGIVGYSERLGALSERLCAAWESANPDFQRRYGYPTDPPGTADLSMCTNQIAARFDAVSLTVEMPFKDNDDAPDPVRGWSPERAARLGASVLDPIAAVVEALR